MTGLIKLFYTIFDTYYKLGGFHSKKYKILVCSGFAGIFIYRSEHYSEQAYPFLSERACSYALPSSAIKKWRASERTRTYKN